MKTVNIWRALAWCVLALAFGMSVYRAKTQTIAHDEALQYEWFLDGGVYHVLQFNPTSHVLFALLAKPIVWALGVKEFSLRAPSLFGAVIYLLATYLLCKRLFGEGILLFLSVAMLCLNPQVLDFMPAARGYILGLAGFTVAMYAMLRVVERGEFDGKDKEWRWRWRCRIASVALALSVVANLTNALPAVCLALTFSVLAAGSFRSLLKVGDQKVRDIGTNFLAPGAAVGFCILWPFLIQARPVQFRFGYKTAFDTLRDVFTASFLYKWTDDIYSSSLDAVAPAAGSWQERVTVLGIYLLLPLFLCFVAGGVILAWRAAGPKSANNAPCRLLGGAAVASVVVLSAVYAIARTNYPSSRYCLFLVPLLTVGGILAGREISSRFPQLHLERTGLAIAALVVLDYALCLQVKEFRYNAYDVISLKLYQAIADDALQRDLKSVRVGGTWWYEPEINFYRRKLQASWMKEYDVKDKSYFWQSPNALAPQDYDYFVFTPEGDPGLHGRNVRVIFQDDTRHLTAVANER